MSDMTDYEAAHAVGTKVLEMADRAAKMHKALPGAQAKWGFEVDNTRFEVVLRVVEKVTDGKSG